MADIFEYQEDRTYFEDLLYSAGGLEKNRDLFDFRPPKIKRDEFNRIRKKILSELIDQYGNICQLACHEDCATSADEVDHLIPLSSNVLNKELRHQKGKDGKKVPTQSFGSNSARNLLLSCRRCNAFKKNKMPSQALILERLAKVRISNIDKPT